MATNNVINNRVSPICFRGNNSAIAGTSSYYLQGLASTPYNYGGSFNPTTGAFIVPVAGTYQFSGVALIDTTSAGYMTLSVYSVTSGILIQVSDGWSATSSQGNINIIQCQYFGAFPAGDTIYMLLTSTGTVDIKLGTFFSGHLIG